VNNGDAVSFHPESAASGSLLHRDIFWPVSLGTPNICIGSHVLSSPCHLPKSREYTVLDRACQSTVNSQEVNSKSGTELRRDALRIMEYTPLSGSLTLRCTMLRMRDNPSIHLMGTTVTSAPLMLMLTREAITVAAAMPRQRLILLLATTPGPRRGWKNNTLLFHWQTPELTLQYEQSPLRRYRNIVRLRTRTSTSARVIVALARVQTFDCLSHSALWTIHFNTLARILGPCNKYAG
jgi:hypothetical protein